MNVEIEEGLVCPNCGCNNLHQIVIVTNSRGEDAKAKTMAVDNRTGEIFNCWEDGLNPSPRRQGLSIQFDCEQCDSFPMLHVFQHKGTTYLEWDGRPWRDRAFNLARCLTRG